jgi:hypothetical protein
MPIGIPSLPIGLAAGALAQQIAALYIAMADASQPLPGFIEGWALNSFNGIDNSAPTAAGIPADSIGQLDLEYTVSGAAGAASLTISAGDQSKGTGQWGGVIQHDDGTYGLYTVNSLAAGVCSMYPALRATVTAQTLRNSGGAVNGQHYTLPGYKALARSIFARTKGDCYRNRYVAKWTAADGAKADWTETGGMTSGQFSFSTSNASTTLGWTGRGNKAIQGTPTSPYTGKGLTKTFAIGGAGGFMEAFVSCWKTPEGFAPFRVKLVIDGVTISNASYDSNSGLKRVIIPYSGGTSAVLTVTRDDETAGGYSLRIGDVTFWSYDRAETWTNPVIDKNANVVVLGDSWSAFYANGLGTELQAAITGAGGTGTVSTVALSGQTAEWGLANFDALVAPLAPAQVVVEFFTNDKNSFGAANYGRWLIAMYQIGLKCQAIGARPIFVMPQPTQSFSQSVDHGIWAEKIGTGLPL